MSLSQLQVLLGMLLLIIPLPFFAILSPGFALGQLLVDNFRVRVRTGVEEQALLALRGTLGRGADSRCLMSLAISCGTLAPLVLTEGW